MMKKNKNDSYAVIQNNHLILSYPDATEPVLWRKNLDEIGSASFEIKKEKENFSLVLNKGANKKEKIVTFNDKQSALTALSSASDALLNGEKKSRAPSNQNHKPKWHKLFIILGVIVLLIAMYNYMSAQMPQNVNFETPNSNTNTMTGTSPQSDVGVPMSADEFLSEF